MITSTTSWEWHEVWSPKKPDRAVMNIDGAPPFQTFSIEFDPASHIRGVPIQVPLCVDMIRVRQRGYGFELQTREAGEWKPWLKLSPMGSLTPTAATTPAPAPSSP